VQSLNAGTVQHPFDGDVFNAAAQKQQRLNASARLSFALNGAIYLIKTSQFQSTKRLVDPDTVGIEMSAKTGLDIDTFEDLKSAAELMGV
jgi:CMP-N-acetylneuraminic acid synthetase